jgi:hypothetical protein
VALSRTSNMFDTNEAMAFFEPSGPCRALSCPHGAFRGLEAPPKSRSPLSRYLSPDCRPASLTDSSRTLADSRTLSQTSYRLSRTLSQTSHRVTQQTLIHTHSHANTITLTHSLAHALKRFRSSLTRSFSHALFTHTPTRSQTRSLSLSHTRSQNSHALRHSQTRRRRDYSH